MDDRIATGDERIDRVLIREIARDDFLVRRGVRGQSGSEIRHPDCFREFSHARTNDLAYTAGGAGQQQTTKGNVRNAWNVVFSIGHVSLSPISAATRSFHAPFVLVDRLT